MHMTVIQVYAPMTAAENVEIEEFYEAVQKVVNESPRGDVLYIIGDWNAKIRNEQSARTTGKFGLGKRNEWGD